MNENIEEFKYNLTRKVHIRNNSVTRAYPIEIIISKTNIKGIDLNSNKVFFEIIKNEKNEIINLTKKPFIVSFFEKFFKQLENKYVYFQVIKINKEVMINSNINTTLVLLSHIVEIEKIEEINQNLLELNWHKKEDLEQILNDEKNMNNLMEKTTKIAILIIIISLGYDWFFK